MRPRFRFLIAPLLGILFLPLLPEVQAQQSGKEATHNQKGLDYYNEAFYGRMPKGQQREADQAFDLALAEFRQAIALKPDYLEARKNLARLFWVRGKYAEAAESYRNVLKLAPGDIDTHVLLALAYCEMNQYQEAEKQLGIAKSRTSDPEAIRKLDGYTQKIRERK
jgi:tetratricopeptide (TPR) repeat protein